MRASNSELVKPLPEHERTLNRRLRRQNRRVPYDQINNPAQHPRIAYPPVLNINYFRYFVDILQNYDPMDDEPMWAADHVVAPTPVVFCEITQEVLNAAAGGIFLYKTPNQAYQLLKGKVLLKLDWVKNQKTKSSLKKTVAFADEGSSNLDTDKIMARVDVITLKMDAQYKELQSNAKKQNLILMKMTYLCPVKKKPNSCKLFKQFNDFMKSQQSTNAFVKETFMDLKTQLETIAKNHQASIQNLETKFDRLADKQFGRPSGSLPSNTHPNPKGHNSKAYQPPQSRNEYVNAVFTRSGKSYKQPINPNNQQNDSETPINFDSDNEEEEPTP
ncbi:hypothetical protein Tco_1406164 [Tanacetum coccineum]